MAGRLPDLAGFPYASYTQKASMVSGTSCPSETTIRERAESSQGTTRSTQSPRGTNQGNRLSEGNNQNTETSHDNNQSTQPFQGTNESTWLSQSGNQSTHSSRGASRSICPSRGATQSIRSSQDTNRSTKSLQPTTVQSTADRIPSIMTGLPACGGMFPYSFNLSSYSSLPLYGEIPQKDFQKRELSAEPKVRHSKKEWKLLKGKFFKKDRKVLPPQDLVKLESSVECEGTQLEPERAGTSQQDIDSLEWPVERTRSEEELEELKAFTRVCTPILKENCTWTEDFDINSNVETSPTRPNDCQHRSTTESYENPNLDNHLHGNRESFIMKRAKAELKEDSETALSLGIISQEPDSMLGRTISQISFEGVADFTKVFKEDKENDECVISAMESIPISYVERDTGIELVKPYESEEMPSAQIGPAEIGSAPYKPYESQDVPTDYEVYEQSSTDEYDKKLEALDARISSWETRDRTMAAKEAALATEEAKLRTVRRIFVEKERELEKREQALAEGIASLEKREQSLLEHEKKTLGCLAQRERASFAREREVARCERELHEIIDEREMEFHRREQQLYEREQSLEVRETAVTFTESPQHDLASHIGFDEEHDETARLAFWDPTYSRDASSGSSHQCR